MKSLITAIFSMLLVLLPAAAQTSDASAVSQAIVSLGKAMIAADASQLERLTSPQLSYGHAGGQVQTQAEFIAGATSGKVVFRDIKVDRPVLVIDGDVALDRHQATYQVEMGGKSSTVEIEIFHVWTKRDGVWRLLARQAFKLS